MKARLTLFLALLLLCTGAALATSPDGETSSEETACDGEAGAAYGLCNAYCEAMDCDSDDAQASETACTKVRDKFTNITGRTSLPCEGPVCPCNVPGTIFGNFVAGNIPITTCRKGDIGPDTIGIQLTSAALFASTYHVLSSNTLACNPPDTGISDEEFMLCSELLEQAATDQGVTCVMQ
jgi:hypothetical protein